VKFTTLAHEVHHCWFRPNGTPRGPVGSTVGAPTSGGLTEPDRRRPRRWDRRLSLPADSSAIPTRDESEASSTLRFGTTFLTPPEPGQFRKPHESSPARRHVRSCSMNRPQSPSRNGYRAPPSSQLVGGAQAPNRAEGVAVFVGGASPLNPVRGESRGTRTRCIYPSIQPTRSQS
jgi:hypothetical protein